MTHIRPIRLSGDYEMQEGAVNSGMYLTAALGLYRPLVSLAVEGLLSAKSGPSNPPFR
jgi:hypothetical protein